ncbi:MAG: NYN domain-containing protein [Candidatus Accumulibacter sp.]|uniref:NYN domain-containing protein n=1 Tax=Accumulibacter sp. TaxID=2053492 RepID=UPI001B29972D|nr:NYN domain-containing protein [Accumulibacter sp.]MBO3709225.1 NYN domain-containing protein [Accumulibacter sp.]
MNNNLPVFALLVDADNVTREALAPIIEDLTRDTRIAVRRVYGDFTTQHLASWRDAIANHGFHPIQQYRNSVGKNSSDSALIIDAMDLLHSGRFDGFCVVSSDGDFTRLATRIRENGLSIYGYGRNDTAKAFVNACERFTYIERLLDSSGRTTLPLDVEAAPNAVEAVPTAVAGQVAKPAIHIEMPGIPAAAFVASPLALERLKSQLLRSYTNVADEDGWALISRVAQYLRANQSDFDPRHYGAGTFSRLLQAVAIFEVVQRKQGNGHAHFCRPRKTLAQPIKPDQVNRTVPTEYVEALKDAVTQSQRPDGWSSPAAIGYHLHAMGRKLEESGCATLHEALGVAGIFEMRETNGTRKEFRLTTANRR